MNPLIVLIPTPQIAYDERHFVPFTALACSALMAAVKVGITPRFHDGFSLLQPELLAVPTPVINLAEAKVVLEQIFGMPVVFAEYDDAAASEVAA